MPRELRISDRAARDLATIWGWYRANASQEQAYHAVRSLVGAIKNLPFTPLASLPDPATGGRARAVGCHIIVYDVESIAGVGPRAGHVNLLAILPPG